MIADKSDSFFIIVIYTYWKIFSVKSNAPRLHNLIRQRNIIKMKAFFSFSSFRASKTLEIFIFHFCFADEFESDKRVKNLKLFYAKIYFMGYIIKKCFFRIKAIFRSTNELHVTVVQSLTHCNMIIVLKQFLLYHSLKCKVANFLGIKCISRSKTSHLISFLRLVS